MTKQKQARNVKVGEFINTTNGMREVLKVVPKCWPSPKGPPGKPFAIEIYVQDPGSASGSSDLLFDPTYFVEVRK